MACSSELSLIVLIVEIDGGFPHDLSFEEPPDGKLPKPLTPVPDGRTAQLSLQT